MSALGDLDADIARVLRETWGFESLRPIQREVVEAALNGRDAVVVMPTGGGKSLCYQLPALLTGRLTVVVSPLIALMQDQVDALGIVGVPAAALNSTLRGDQEREILRRLTSNEIRLLYVSPERLLLPPTMNLLQRAAVARFAIDEAHCISAWGHDFRPEYRQLNRIKEAFPGIPVQAFTATATPKVQRDIAIQLQLERPRRFVGVFDRPNLTYRIVAKDDAVGRTIEAVRRFPDEGVIVYCLSRKDTETLAASLAANGIPAVAYHAGLPNETRRQIGEDFAREKANVVVATVAFGMGIDRANVRCVIHECLPKSLEGYQQETGRAGRDGLPSECVLLYNHGDVLRLRRLLSEGDANASGHHLRLLDEVRRFVTSNVCRHKALSEHFGQPYELPEEGCGACDVCLGGTEVMANGAEIARHILSATRDLAQLQGGRGFGVAFLSEVLTGAKRKAIPERRADTVAGYGVFRRERRERVVSWIHQLIDLGLLEVTEGAYPVVLLTPEGRACLEADAAIELVENRALVRAPKRRDDAPPHDADLFERLRQWRREVAARRGVPPYVVFHDATLIRIAAALPRSAVALEAISGVGQRRAAEYGAEIIALIAETPST
jgi:ATP-dependent DNA helicase RecQ